MQGGRGRPIAPSCRVSERASLFRALCRFKEQMAFIHAAAESYLPQNWVSDKRVSRKSISDTQGSRKPSRHKEPGLLDPNPLGFLLALSSRGRRPRDGQLHLLELDYLCLLP